MAEPLPPQGFIRLKDAYDTFHFGWIGDAPDLANGYGEDHAAFAARSDAANQFFVSHLSRLAYGGMVIAPNGTPHEITGELFDRTGFADLLPLHNSIPVGTKGPLGNYVGGIVCFEGARFFDWLKTELSIHLHGEIQNGNLDISEANERLKTINLPALHQLPPIDSFRDAALKEPYWTLPMAVAWIAWRNIDDVVKQYWPYSQHAGYWRESRGPNQTHIGAVWEKAEEPTLQGLMNFEAHEVYHDNPPRLYVKESREQLWRKLLEGQFSAIGRENGASHSAIAKERWASLEISHTLRGSEFVGVGQYGDSEKIYDVKLPSKDILRLWPLSLATNDATGIIQISQGIIPEYFVAWMELENSRATDSLRTSFMKLGRQQAAVGSFQSGGHIVALIDAFKVVSLAHVEKCFDQADSENVETESIEALASQLMGFVQSCEQTLLTQLAKVAPQIADRTKVEMTSRISKAKGELEAVCKIRVLKAQTRVASDTKSAQTKKPSSNGSTQALINKGAVAVAFEAIFGAKKPPTGVSAKDRNNRIAVKITELGLTQPATPNALQKAVERHLRTLAN